MNYLDADAPAQTMKEKADRRSNLSEQLGLSRELFRDATRNLVTEKRPSPAGGDLSASSVIFTLVLLGTILAGHTDHPVFWLLVGPAPLGIGFTAIMVFRRGLGQNHSTSPEPARYCEKPEPWSRSERNRQRRKERVLKYLRNERRRLSAGSVPTMLFVLLLSCCFVFGTIWIRQAAVGFSASAYEALTLFSLGLAVLMQLVARIHTLRWVVLAFVIVSLLILMAITFRN
jgi:hypothetical protein